MKQMIFTQKAYAEYKRTVAMHPPETGGILIGRPDDPFVIRDFRFCPPSKSDDGSYNLGLTHFGIDSDYINWAIDNEWGPNGEYVIGFLHSHPRGVTSLSGGSMDGVAGDIPLLTACLEAPEMKAAGIEQLLAPITTFDRNGTDEIHGWMLRRGTQRPERVEVVIESVETPLTVGPVVRAPSNADADLIDDFVLRRRALLSRSGLGISDRRLARRLYAKAAENLLPDEDKPQVLPIAPEKKGEA